MNSRNELEGLARAIFDSLADIDGEGRRDKKRIAAHFAPDLLYRIPFLPNEIQFNDRDGFMHIIGASEGLFRKIVYSLDNFIIDVDTQSVAVEARGVRPLLKTGHEIKLKYVFVFKFRGNEVCEFREYGYCADQNIISQALNLDSFSEAKAV